MSKPNEKLTEIYESARQLGKYFTDKKGSNYCFLNDGYTILQIDSSRFYREVMKHYKNSKSEIIKVDDVKSILGHLINLCDLNVLNYNINQRTTFFNNKIYIDLSDTNDHTIVVISRNEIEEYDGTEIPLLESRNNMLSLPRHDRNADIDDLMTLIDKYFMVDGNYKLLLAVYMVTLFIQPIQTPILLLTGSKGSGKSVCLKFLKKLVDPTKEDISIFPNGERDLSIILNNSYFVAFDNVSSHSISSNASDMLCVAITGGVKIARKLYTDGELVHMYLKNKIAMTGIGNLVSKSDVLDRSLIIPLKRINAEKRKSPAILEEQFEKDIPQFLGSIYKILQETLNTIDDVNIKNISRLYDFCRYGFAIAEVIGKGNGEKFIKQYEETLKELNMIALQENCVAICIIKLMENRYEYIGSMTDLYKKVCIIAEQDFIDRKHNFPRATNIFSTHLEGIKSNLEEVGIVYTKRNVGSHKEVHLTNLKYCENKEWKKQMLLSILSTLSVFKKN